MSMFTNSAPLLSIRGPRARSAPVSAGGGHMEAVLQPTLVEAPVSLDTGSSKVTATCHVIQCHVSRVTPTIFNIQDRRAAAETQPFVALLICGYGLTIYIDNYNIYHIYNIYNICRISVYLHLSIMTPQVASVSDLPWLLQPVLPVSHLPEVLRRQD